MIAFSINTSPLFDPKTQEGNLMLENPKNNAKLLVAQVVLNEGQKTLYTSKAIQPGSYLERIRLEQPLAEGDDEQTQDLIGQTGAAVTLTVQNQ